MQTESQFIDQTSKVSQPPRLEKPARITEQVWPEGTVPVVSIKCITYQHGNFIRDAIEGFLMQETTFPVEIAIHDDASTDGTADIVREYKAKYPQLIQTVLQTENQWSKGTKPTKFIEELVRGEFVALCEGDDYWTSPHKLQKQVVFLQENPDYSMCFHRVKVLHADGSMTEDFYSEERFNKIESLPACRLDLLKQGNFIQTASVVYRKRDSDYPPEFRFSPVGDYLLHICNSEQGPIHRFDEIMGVYRMGVGIYSTLPLDAMRKKILQYNTCVLSFLKDESERLVILEKCLRLINEIHGEQDAKVWSLRKAIKNRIKAFFR